MAKTKQKGGKGKSMSVRTISSRKERKTGGNFVRLKTDEVMKGYALFSPDPEVEGNVGWFEYLEHFDKPNNQFVPCLGENCYMCELGENPSGRALTLWYFPDADEKDRFKSFKANGFLIRDFEEIEDEEGGVMGRRFRVKRMTDDGKYRVSPQADKKLSEKEIKKLLKEAAEQFNFPEQTLGQAKRALAKIDAVDALTESDDDDDDDDDETPKAKRGKEKKEKPVAEEEDDDEDEDDDDEDDDTDDEDENEDENEDDDDDDDDEEDDDDDEEDDEDDDEDENDDDDEEEEDEEEEALKGQKAVVVKPDEANENISAKLDGEGKAVKLFVGEGLEPDWDKIVKGAEITVDALKDDEGDWVMTSLKVKAAGKGKGKTKGKK